MTFDLEVVRGKIVVLIKDYPHAKFHSDILNSLGAREDLKFDFVDFRPFWVTKNLSPPSKVIESA